ncbi:hypothetical protein [Lysinibacillus xylanilyticus]|uniref:hypothetical protein n=1 Tax=Lysinibacillus xylanilyticus TaxID=582475 RepID=UPI0036DCAA54
MTRTKLFIRSSVKNGITQEWLENEEGQKVDVSPRECFKCTEGIWDGHIMTATENTYCTSCFKEKFDKVREEQMYKNGAQIYTQWGYEDLNPELYEVVKQPN